MDGLEFEIYDEVFEVPTGRPAPSVPVPALRAMAEGLRVYEASMRGFTPPLPPLKVSVLTDIAARGFRGPKVPSY